MKKTILSLALLGLSTMAAVAHAAGYGVVSLERVVENSSYLKQQSYNHNNHKHGSYSHRNRRNRKNVQSLTPNYTNISATNRSALMI